MNDSKVTDKEKSLKKASNDPFKCELKLRKPPRGISDKNYLMRINNDRF